MNTQKKVLLAFACVALLIAGSVFGTLAYLTDTEYVKNTFTVGKVGLTLDEADVKPDGTLDAIERVQENEYHLLPGHNYIKDPTVTVDAGSEDAYVRMIVTVERIDQLKAALPYSETVVDDDDTTHQVVNNQYYADDAETFLLQMLCGGWYANIWLFEGYTENTDGTEGYYEFRYHKTVAGEDDSGQNLDNELEPLFTEIKVPGEIDNEHLACLKDVEINVTAHAIQAAGFGDADAAWAAFEAQPN